MRTRTYTNAHAHTHTLVFLNMLGIDNTICHLAMIELMRIVLVYPFVGEVVGGVQ